MTRRAVESRSTAYQYAVDIGSRLLIAFTVGAAAKWLFGAPSWGVFLAILISDRTARRRLTVNVKL